jgi:GWxTD domain-containing protein
MPPLLLALLAASPSYAGQTPQQERVQWNKPTPQWWQGPVRYALTDGETASYKTLVTKLQRAAFIARFWAARDPDPGTLRNEAEEIFWQRVSAADELFTVTTLAGWRTDRGRIYVLLGPPDEINSYNVPSVAELDPTHFPDGMRRGTSSSLMPGQRGAVNWIYRGLPSKLADAGQSLTFVKDETGEFRLSGDLAATFRIEMQSLYSAAEPWRATPTRGRGAPDTSPRPAPPPNNPATSPLAQASSFEARMRSVEDLFAWGQSALFEKMEAPRAPTGSVSASEFFGVFPLRHQLAFFQGSEGTTALLTLGVPGASFAPPEGSTAPAGVQIFGSLERIGDPSRVYQFTSDRKPAEAPPTQSVDGIEHRIYEVTGIILPGEYRVSLGAKIGNRMGTVSDLVSVPDFRVPVLSLAGPVLAEEVGALDGAGKDAFAWGQIKMIPKLDATYAPASNFGFYFQVYHARTSPSDGKLHLDIEYAIAKREAGIFQPLGKPISLSDNPAPAHAYHVPLQGWSPGDYLLSVTVGDRIGGEVAAGTVSFQVR